MSAVQDTTLLVRQFISQVRPSVIFKNIVGT